MQLIKKTLVYTRKHAAEKHMFTIEKIQLMKIKTILLLLFIGLSTSVFAQEGEEPTTDNEEYIEFNDRKNVVHGVYLGLNFGFGEIDNKDTFMGGFKVAYVANQQFEVGFEGKFLYSEQRLMLPNTTESQDLIGGYGGLHLEPILFSKSLINLSFPLLIGGGAVGYVDSSIIQTEEEVILDESTADFLFILEPGVSALFNINRYLQLEAGVKYRFSNQIDLFDSPITRINGFSAGIGIKVGVFNMGRNRYKKNID